MYNIYICSVERVHQIVIELHKNCNIIANIAIVLTFFLPSITPKFDKLRQSHDK